MSTNQQKFDELKTLVDEWREEANIPGTVVGISYGDEEFTYGSGVTSIENPLAVTDETLFQIGSATKTVTATAMMRLVEEGKLDLDAPLQQYLPEFRVQDETISKTVKVKHLITHSAGWSGDVFVDTGTNDDSLTKYVNQMAELPQVTPLDYAFSYNNSAFSTAGRVIEVVTDKVYEVAIRELIFEPLGLEKMFFFPREVMTHRFMVGHRLDEEKIANVQRPWEIPRSSNPAGAIASDIKNLLAYGRFHLGDGSPLLSTDSLQMMHRPHFSINDESGSMGLAWFVGDVNGTKTLQHGGTTLGQNCQFLLIPDHNFVFGMATNADGGRTVMNKVEKWILKEFFDLEYSLPEPYDVPVEELEAYAGFYSRDIVDIDLKLEDNQLNLYAKVNGGFPGAEPPPPYPVAPLAMCGDDQMIVTDGQFKDLRVEFLRDEAGAIEYLRFGLRISAKSS